eukprot:CAMPEP_0204266068 /NCGR_PEP_ID=MMETSP0468-20130131/10095_1 /ASSEMBLY_ACC=CAM_ASM_000383 /TAXON_ID=2969 /ORGANISM="Oxyrrhis marina" /LENGTH=118 /DNA_ID=CAMNT_0051241091 /DNA_START=15 /DNA_END=372 /DNA_ORIENTATION=+
MAIAVAAMACKMGVATARVGMPSGRGPAASAACRFRPLTMPAAPRSAAVLNRTRNAMAAANHTLEAPRGPVQPPAAACWYGEPRTRRGDKTTAPHKQHVAVEHRAASRTSSGANSARG